MTEREKRTIKDIVNDINKLKPADQTAKDMMIVFANGMMAGESIGYAKAMKEVIAGDTITDR